MKEQELIEALKRLAPPQLACEWDNPGLLVGKGDREIDSVYLALDATSEAIANAARERCGMIITHHPMIFHAVKYVRGDDFTGKRIIAILEHNMEYYAMHTNFDSAVMGELVSRKLGIEPDMTLEPVTEDGRMGIGAVGTLRAPVTLEELTARVRAEFGLPPVRFYGDPAAKITRAAICPGAGSGMDGPAIAAGADVLITGDVSHHYGLDSLEKGLCIIDAGHHGLEHVFVDYMAGWFAENYPQIRIVRDQNASPFHVV